MSGAVVRRAPATLGSIADLKGKAGASQRGWVVPGAEELFRSLYTGFEAGSGSSFAVCSAVQGEGKTTISLGLAIVIAQDLPDRRVVIVETDLWRPVLAKDFGIEPSPGLVDCLTDRQPITAALRATSLDNLSLLVAGNAAGGGQRLLRSARMSMVVDELKRTHDVVILDTPAALAHSEVALLSRMIEDVIFVVRPGVTPARDLATALGRLHGSKVRGVVMNDAQSSVPVALRRLVRL